MARVQLNRKLRLETVYRERDGAGGYVETWQLVGELWAQVRSGSGKEADQEGLTVSSVPYKITVRAAPHGAASRPVPGQRFRDGTRIFRILAVSEADDGARYLTCYAREEEISS